MPYSPPFASPFLTRRLVEKALDIITPAMDVMFGGIAKRHAGHLRVSAYRDTTVLNAEHWETMLTRDFGDRSKWEHPYEEVATDKEEISQQTGLSSREVQMLYPELLKPGQTVYFGSVTRSGVVVAFSGVEAFFDELFAKWLLDTIMALIEQIIQMDRDDGLTNYGPASASRPRLKLDPPYCMKCGIQMQRAGSVHACPSCGDVSEA